MASAPSGTNGGACESNIVSTVLLDFVTVMPTTLGAHRSNNVDHSSSDFLYHFGQRLQRPGPGVRRGSAAPGRSGPAPAPPTRPAAARAAPPPPLPGPRPGPVRPAGGGRPAASAGCAGRTRPARSGPPSRAAGSPAPPPRAPGPAAPGPA